MTLSQMGSCGRFRVVTFASPDLEKSMKEDKHKEEKHNAGMYGQSVREDGRQIVYAGFGSKITRGPLYVCKRLTWGGVVRVMLTEPPTLFRIYSSFLRVGSPGRKCL